MGKVLWQWFVKSGISELMHCDHQKKYTWIFDIYMIFFDVQTTKPIINQLGILGHCSVDLNALQT